MNYSLILSIETSCDETSIAIVKNGKEILSLVTNTQIDKFKDLGGVVPEMASRMHSDNIFYVYEEALNEANVSIDEIDAIAVTKGPGLMGALLVGVNFAKTLSLIHNKPLIGVNHMKAHIYAVNLENDMKFPHLSLIVSGGHTELIYLKENMCFEKIGSTLDDAVGESYDKVARLLGLPYPGGVEIDRLAVKGNPTYNLPMPKKDKTLDFSFSGLKSACFNLVNSKKMKNEEIDKTDFATSFQNTVVDTLMYKFNLAYQKYEPIQCSVVGGVSANSLLREKMTNAYENIILPSNKFSTDNAAMIGAVAHYMYLNNEFETLETFDVDTSFEI